MVLFLVFFTNVADAKCSYGGGREIDDGAFFLVIIVVS